MSELSFDRADVAVGIFSITAEAIELIQGPQFSYDMLVALGAVGRDFFEIKLYEFDLIDRISAIDATLADLSRKLYYLGRPQLIYFTLVMSIVATLCAVVNLKPAFKSRDYAQEQTAIARESLTIQKTDKSTEPFQKDVLSRMDRVEILMMNGSKAYTANRSKKTSEAAPKSKSPLKSETAKLSAQGKTKNSDIRSAELRLIGGASLVLIIQGLRRVGERLWPRFRSCGGLWCGMASLTRQKPLRRVSHPLSIGRTF